ncbi:MAG: hypothetical protein M3250_01965 [Thermoproteota archaeon]|nr:hypothetical protein [Thermoproteota archaeon]
MKITLDCDQSTPSRFKFGDGWMFSLYSITSQRLRISSGGVGLNARPIDNGLELFSQYNAFCISIGWR